METLAGWAARVALRQRWLSALAGLAAVLVACVPQTPGARGPFPQFAEYEGYEVEEVRFVGELELPADSLRAVVITREPQCWLLFLPICLPGTNFGRDAYELDLDELSRDVVRLQLYYRDHGYYGTRVVPSVDPDGEERVVVRFAIDPGDEVILQRLEVTGTEGVLDSALVRRAVPLEVGEPFRRIGFLQSADTVESLLLSRGYAYADVLRNYLIDTIADVAEAQFDALPGPLVRVDTVLFVGANRLSERTLRKQITIREGQLLRVPELTRSQRNLYELAMVSFASVELAPDTLQLDEDRGSATVLVRVVEAPEYVVDAALGVGTVECVRTEGSYTDRNFVGGARLLEVSGFVSRIGAGDPLSTRTGKSFCGEALDDRLFGPADNVNPLTYRLAADFNQPRLFQTRNELGVLLHAERVTELRAFLRQSVGGQVRVGRELGERAALNTTLTVQRGSTLASPAAYCIGFDVCQADEVRGLREPRWSNSLSLSGLYDRTRTVGSITRGYVARANVDWASRLLRSDNRYLRVLGDVAAYRQIRPGYVLAGHARGGTFLRGALGREGGFIPPELRFYAGGPASVRGVPPNALGPTAYVITVDTTREGTVEADTTRSSIGGTRMLVLSGEVRMPSPVLPEFLRTAVFVDAGQVWAREEQFRTSDLVVTPGVGLRIHTPVGPARFDIAYNSKALPGGPLYLLDRATGDLLLVDSNHPADPPGSFWERLEFSFAIGQAF